MELTEILTRIYPLPSESIDKIAEKVDKIEIKKGSMLVEADKICRNVFFVAEGIVRAFCYAKGRDITFWIGEEGTVALSMQSYINGRAGYESIATVENCLLYKISTDDLHELYRQDIHIANWGRVFAEKEILRAEKALIPQLFTTGSERYEQLIREQPHLLNRIPLENLASYLGVTPVTLSRIRSNK
ncbi:MAG: Crp/Fnr family transcriptional regulator [Muribaculaceae bacterium]|nr:Crp/Fnr family transcriptional regulator [Muribaculaceae bacterium]